MNRDFWKSTRPQARLRQGRADWFRFENVTDSEATIYIYDEIGYFGVTAADFVRELNQVHSNVINLHVNSPGGDVFDAVAIYNALKTHKATVNVQVDALAASAASFIAMSGDTVAIARNAEMMIHDAHGLAIGNSVDMRDLADRLDQVSDNIADIYAQRTGKPVATWRKAMKAETWYSASEAVKAGLADHVVGEEPDGPSNTWDLSIYAYANRDEAPEPVEEETFTFDAETLRRSLQEAFR
jgi:ATP-dependent Clp endopeptidase proteolytic subunit ClpP